MKKNRIIYIVMFVVGFCAVAGLGACTEENYGPAKELKTGEDDLPIMPPPGTITTPSPGTK